MSYKSKHFSAMAYKQPNGNNYRVGPKYIGVSESAYKNVAVIDYLGNKRYLGYYSKKKKSFDTEREAAIYVDKCLIERGKEPINILKRVL